MIKKIFAIFTFVLIFFGISKIQAVSFEDTINIQKNELEKLIEINEGEEWKDLDINKCEYKEEEDIYIYPMENKKGNDNAVRISENKPSDIAMRIVLNGYGNKSASSYGMEKEDDLYVATKIALDCVYSYNDLQDLTSKFRAKEGLDGVNKQRAEKIIEVATNLLNKGYSGTETMNWVIYTNQTYRYQEEGEYYYKTFTIEAENADINSIEIARSSDRLQGYFIAEDGTFESKTSFNKEDMKDDMYSFRLVIPKEETLSPFHVDLFINLNYNTYGLFKGENSDGSYIVYGNLKQDVSYTVSASDKESTLTVKFVDSETDEPISGAIVQIDGTQCVAYNDDGAVYREAGTGTTYVYFSYIPSDYITPETPKEVTLDFMDDYEETIKLKHKKGGLLIKTNLSNSTFEIYNSKFEKVGTYETDEKGEIIIDSINTGKYVLRQVGVKEGYKLSEEKTFDISYNITNTVYITNEENPKEEEMPKEEESSKEEAPKEEEMPKEESPKEEDLNEENPEDKNLESKDVGSEDLEGAAKDNNSLKLSVLPRTGNDYFILKIVLINLVIIFTYIKSRLH